MKQLLTERINLVTQWRDEYAADMKRLKEGVLYDVKSAYYWSCVEQLTYLESLIKQL